MRSCGSLDEVPAEWKSGNITHILKRETRKTREMQASQFRLSAWQNHGADSSGKYAKAWG